MMIALVMRDGVAESVSSTNPVCTIKELRLTETGSLKKQEEL
jgi:hypothetical protein